MIPFFLVLIVIVIGAVAAYFFLREPRVSSEEETHRWTRMLQKDYPGSVRQISGVPILFFQQPGFEVAVELVYRNGFTMHVKPEFPFQGHLRIGPEVMKSVAARMLGRTDYTTGYEEFDRQFLVLGEPESFVRKSMTADICASLRILGAFGDPVLQLSPRQFMMRMATISGQRDRALEAFVRRGLEYARAFPKVEPVETEELQKTDLAGTQCQVCGAELCRPVAECTRCATPHHEECWNFMGHCSTFACGSLAFRKK